MVGVLGVGRRASPRLPFSSPPPSLSAHHRGSSPGTTLTSGAGQSTSTGKSPAAGEALALSLHACSVPHLHPFLGSRARHPAPSPHSCTHHPTDLTRAACSPDPILPCIFPFLRKESRGGPSRWGVALLRPEPLHRGTADTFLNRVKKLPCQITRCEAAGKRGQLGWREHRVRRLQDRALRC